MKRVLLILALVVLLVSLPVAAYAYNQFIDNDFTFYGPAQSRVSDTDGDLYKNCAGKYNIDVSGSKNNDGLFGIAYVGVNTQGGSTLYIVMGPNQYFLPEAPGAVVTMKCYTQQESMILGLMRLRR